MKGALGEEIAVVVSCGGGDGVVAEELLQLVLTLAPFELDYSYRFQSTDHRIPRSQRDKLDRLGPNMESNLRRLRPKPSGQACLTCAIESEGGLPL